MNLLAQATSHFCAQKEKEKETGELEGGWKRKEEKKKPTYYSAQACFHFVRAYLVMRACRA